MIAIFVPLLFIRAMESYELKHGTDASAYDVPEGEQVGNSIENHDLQRLGYKPELEVFRAMSCSRTGLPLTSAREDSACGV